LEMTEAEQSFTFDGLDARPVASVLRGFSAPVVLAHDLSKEERLLLLAHDSDPFNRWEAGRTLARQSVLATITAGSAPDAEWLASLQAVLGDETLEPAYRALMLGRSTGQELDRRVVENIRSQGSDGRGSGGGVAIDTVTSWARDSS